VPIPALRTPPGFNTDATERHGHLHVMKRGNCRHDIEGRRLERARQEVATHIADPVIRILGLGQLEARLVEIDAGDVGHAPPKLSREHALTAADVECSPRPVRDSIKDQRIIVNVVIPPVSRSRHSPIVPLAALLLSAPRWLFGLAPCDLST